MQMSASTDTMDIPTGFDRVAEAKKYFFSNLRWHVLFCLLEKRGSLTISEMARKTGMDVSETVRALEAMELLGFIARGESGYVQQKSFVKNTVNKNEIMSQYVLTSAQANNRILETAGSLTHKTLTLTYNSNRKLVDELLANIGQVIEEFKRKSDLIPEKWDNIYNLSYSLAEMIEEKV